MTLKCFYFYSMPHNYYVLNNPYPIPIPNPHGTILPTSQIHLILLGMEQPIIAHTDMSHRVLHVPDVLIALETLDEFLALPGKDLGLGVGRDH